MSSYVCPLCLHNEPEFSGDFFVSAECGHIFHKECVLGMTRTGITKCPLNCHEPIRELGLRRLFGVGPSSDDTDYDVSAHGAGSSGSSQLKDRITSSPNPSADISYNIILIGETGVGKTCLLHRFHDNVYYTPPSTVAVDLFFRTVQIGNSSVQLRIWDTAGQERFRSITPAFIREAHGILFVYDITSSKTFEKVPYWAEFVSQHGPENSVRVLVGNKCDAEEGKRQVSVENGAKTGESLNMRFFETSAKDAINVEASFRAVASLLLADSKIIPIRKGANKGSEGKTKLSNQSYKRIGERDHKTCCN
ncbi:unnamed protein product [Orchesella dallaii]|uniref:RING-type domain-containing protein n=1 Tax=Orchesella dallaii TaxID=48710 RepID=A0ABP1PYI2_9HEXA